MTGRSIDARNSISGSPQSWKGEVAEARSSGWVRVLGLVPNTLDSSPGQRFRIEQWQPYLQRHGIEISFEPFESEELSTVLHMTGRSAQKAALIGSALARRVQTLKHAKGRFDCAYVFREASMLGPALERWLTRIGLPYVFDFDDAIFVGMRSPTNGYLSLLKNPTRTRVSCRNAAHVMAGNPYLAEYALRFNENVSVVPTTIDLNKYQVDPRAAVPRDGRPVIGWSGSHSTVLHLATVSDALRRLADERAFDLLVIGEPRFASEGVDVRAIPWRPESEVADLQGIDIGIMPLPDDPWTRGKCGLKLLQYMALGIPAVSSPVGVNSHIIHHGSNGFLAATQDEWVSQLRQLLDSPELRAQFAGAGRRTVRDGFSGELESDRVASIFRRVASTEV